MTVMSNRLALEFEQRRNPHPRSTSERTAILDDPGFGTQLHRSHGRRDLDAGRRLARLGGRPVRAVRARPGDGGAALRAGDLRGAEGLPARRTSSVWLFRADQNAERFARSARRLALPVLETEDFLGSIEALVAADVELGARRVGEQSLYLRPFMFASEAFLGVRAAQRVTYCCIASPAGSVLRLRGEAGQDLDLHRPTPGRPPAVPGRPSAAATTPPA